MRSPSVVIQDEYAERTTHFAHGLKVTRRDDYVLAVTSASRNHTIGGVLHKAYPGLDISSIVTTAGLAVGNLELRTLHDETVFTTLEIHSGVWDNASFELFRYNYSTVDDSPGGDARDVLLVGTFGDLKLRENEVVVELRDLRQKFQQPVGVASIPTCRNKLGVNDGLHSFCNVDLESLRVTGTITSVTDEQTFRDSSRAEAADYFGEGIFTFTNGDNNGLSQRVYSYAADGTFVLVRAMLGAVQVGDTYSVVPGCRKRLEEDCRDKYDAVLDFNGEPHRPSIDTLTQPVSISV